MTDDDERHDMRMAAGQASMAMLEAFEDDDVVEALEAIFGWADTLTKRMEPYGVNRHRAAGFIIGAVFAAMTQDDT